MSIQEAPILGRPNHKVRVWQLRENGGAHFLFGLDYISGDPISSCEIAFFDSERQLLLDVDGEIWLIPSYDFYYPGYFDHTEKLINLMTQSRQRREIPELTETEQVEFDRLTSKR